MFLIKSDFSKKKNIAILNDNEFYKESPLLSPVYYLKKSLDSKHNIKFGKIDNIIKQNFSTIIIPETYKISNEYYKKLNEFSIQFIDRKFLKKIVEDGRSNNEIKEVFEDIEIINSPNENSFLDWILKTKSIKNQDIF